jgi:putative inorganic carbon (hco3(-)) transporter
MDWIVDWLVAGTLVTIAAVLAAKRSSFLVDYLIIIYVFNRGLRRLLDYYQGSFNPLSPISLIALAVTAAMFLPFLAHFNTLPKSLKTILICLLVATGYAFLVGFARIQFAAVYSFAEVLAPIGVFGYILTLSPSAETKDRWMRTSGWCAVLACVYGWYQYLTIPPWDAFWVRAVGFEGYLGTLEPTKMAVFSTMAERGVFGGYLGFAIVPMIIAPKWRPLGWVGVLLVLSCILLAGTRTGIILAALSTMIFVMVNKGTGFWQLALGFAVITAAAYFGMGLLPGAQKVQDRFSTLGSIQDDASLQGRMEIYQGSISMILTNPLGMGLGASGISGRINTGGLQGDSTAVIFDAGYAELFLQFGWLGVPLILYALWRMWQEMSIRFRTGMNSTHVMLGRAFMLALIPACFIGNVITTFSILWIVFGAALDPQAFRVHLTKLQLMRDALRSREQGMAAAPVSPPVPQT